MAYTTIDDPSLYFQTKIYTGTGSSNAVTGVNFSPAFTWIKSRTSGEPHILTDVVRGATKTLSSNVTDAETTVAEDLKSFDSDGFTVGTNNRVNKASDNMVAWNWLAGTSFTNDASSTGIGSIDSTGSASDVSGFSIVSYTGTGSAGTIKHGLSSTPNVIIIKKRSSDSGDNSWFVYHDKVITAGASNRSFMLLDTAAALGANGSATTFTSVSSTTFGVGTDDIIGESSHTFIAYCFAEKQGYSKFGSYVGTANADGPMSWLGFEPAYVLFKKTSGSAANWQVWDNKRNTYNPVNNSSLPDDPAADQTDQQVDFLSNGFKIRTTGHHVNGDGITFIYMAFAENPFVTSSGVPATAR